MTAVARTKILVVDDDPGMLESLVMALESEFDVVTATNGREALDVMARQPIDVVLLDLMMPILDGEGYMEEHRQRHAEVPVLMASADLDLPQRAVELGGDDFLAKPFRLSVLETKLRRLASRAAPPGGSGAGSAGTRPATAGAAAGSAGATGRKRRAHGAGASDDTRWFSSAS